MKEILVIRLSAIGDVLLTSPVLSRLRDGYPEARIRFLVKEQCAEFVQAFPQVDDTIVWKKDQSIWDIRQSVGEGVQKFDLIVDLQSNLKTRLLALFIRADNKRRYSKPYLNRILLVFLKINRYREKIKISERYNEALHGLSGLPSLDLKIELTKKPLPRAITRFLEKPTVLFAPGARWATKRWPDEYFVSLASKILEKHPSSQIVWLGGKGEAEIFQFFAGHPYLKRHAKRMLFLAGELSVGEMASLAGMTRVTVSNDSGLMHLMSSAQTPLVALFLSTVEEFGFYPIGNQALVLSARDIPCRPCDHKGRAACPKKHFRCGRELTADQVYGEVGRYL